MSSRASVSAHPNDHDDLRLAEVAPSTSQPVLRDAPGPFPEETGPSYRFPVEDRGLSPEGGYSTHILSTPRGKIETRLYQAPGTTAAVLTVGGVGGGFDTPGRDLYPRLGQELALAQGRFSVLRVKFRNPRQLEEAVYDVDEALAYLRWAQGVKQFGLVGHSFGGAVVLQCSKNNADVRATVTVATQGYGAVVSHFNASNASAPRSVLFIHGDNDRVLPHSISERLYQSISGGPEGTKQLEILRGAGHCIEEGGHPDRLFAVSKAFLLDKLGGVK